jgi:hypothetical protein
MYKYKIQIVGCINSCKCFFVLKLTYGTHVKTHKLLQTCSQAVDKLCSHCLFPVVTSLEQAVNNLYQAWWHYQTIDSTIYDQTCHKVVLTSLVHSWYNKNVTRMTTQLTQGCNNVVISWLYRSCWNNLVTNLITSTRLLQVVTNC